MQNKELYEQFKAIAQNETDGNNFIVIPISNTNHKIGVSKSESTYFL